MCNGNLRTTCGKEMGCTRFGFHYGISIIEQILRLETGKLGVNWWIKLHQTDFEVRKR